MVRQLAAGQSTGFHDHGASSGAFLVATGILEEHRPGERTRVIHPGKPRAFGPDYAHDVRNVSLAPAISIHAYSPPLSDMNEFELDGSRLVSRDRASGKAETADQEWRMQKRKPSDRTGALSIEQVLSAARARLRRLSPDEAYEAMVKTEATLVDLRPEGQRAIESGIAGALVVERNVLEWRFDPASNARLPVATDHDIRVIVFCSEGYTSSLAAIALQGLGLWRATDMIGGFSGMEGNESADCSAKQAVAVIGLAFLICEIFFAALHRPRPRLEYSQLPKSCLPSRRRWVRLRHMWDRDIFRKRSQERTRTICASRFDRSAGTPTSSCSPLQAHLLWLEGRNQPSPVHRCSASSASGTILTPTLQLTVHHVWVKGVHGIRQ